MDLRKFYLENVSEDEYYYKFYNLIKDINLMFDIFGGKQEIGDSEFIVYDIEEAIEKFKYLCLPENEYHNEENKCWFYLVLFYMYKCGICINEFPGLVAHPPADTYDFVNKEIRNRVIAEGNDDNGTVRYAERRKLIARMTFTQQDKHIELIDALERKFKEISNRQASFQNMSIDEKLAEIANLIENLLKKDGKFIHLDYSQISFNYIDDEKIKKYRKIIQCFRHSSEESIIERESYTKEQKMFLIDFGLIVIKVIYFLLHEK